MRLRPLTALLAAALLGAAGCRDAGTGPETAVEPTPFVEATLSTQRVTVGTPIVVDVLFRNAASTPLTIGGGPFAQLEVREEATGRLVARGRFEPLPLVLYLPRTLTPGETARDRTPWAGERTEGGASRAAPGRYLIRAAVTTLGPEEREVYSAPVTVELVAP
jgi:hypothetical protein